MLTKWLDYARKYFIKYNIKKYIIPNPLKKYFIYSLYLEFKTTLLKFFNIRLVKKIKLLGTDKPIFRKYFSLAIKQEKIVRTSKKRTRKTRFDERACRLHVTKKEWYEFFQTVNQASFFKLEWELLYRYAPIIHQVWLLYSQRPLFYLRNFFFLRNTKFYKLFNVQKTTPGIYMYKTNLNYFNIYWGFISFLKALRIWFFSLLIFIGSVYILLIKRVGMLPQTFFFWLCLSMLLYWLLSGFVFFIKKYQYSRFTSVIQRFWRRSYILFWLIESGLLLVFFYLMINPSQESFYMFDQVQFFKTHLFSWKLFLYKSIILVSLITYGYITLLTIKWSSFGKTIPLFLLITILLLYFLWIEFYQIYWVSNFYANFTWFFDLDDGIWTLEWDARRTRILNHYIMILFLLKFWHIVFIFICWIFFLLRATELETITYPMYSFNFQNFIILFLMTWLFMYPWLRNTLHWLIEIPYYWFYVDTHASFYKILIYDSYNFYFYMINHVYFPTFFKISDFVNFQLLDINTDCSAFIKATIRENVLTFLVN